MNLRLIFISQNRKFGMDVNVYIGGICSDFALSYPLSRLSFLPAVWATLCKDLKSVCMSSAQPKNVSVFPNYLWD